MKLLPNKKCIGIDIGLVAHQPLPESSGPLNNPAHIAAHACTIIFATFLVSSFLLLSRGPMWRQLYKNVPLSGRLTKFGSKLARAI